MRLRARFGQAYTLGDLQWCMIHVPDHLRTVRDLANHVSRLLELNLRGGNAEPPQLLLGGFLALHGEELRDVFRDDEVVDVEPSEALGSLTTQLVPAGASPASTPQVGQKRGRAAPDATQVPEAAPTGKQPRRSAGSAPGAGVMAIGWQPPDAGASSAAPAVAANQALAVASQKNAPQAAPRKAQDGGEDEDVDESDEDGEDEPTALPKAARGGARGASFGGGRGRGKASSEEAVAQAPPPAASGTADNRGVFVGGLPLHVDDAALRSHFQFYGAIEEATVVINQNTQQSKGYGFVEFKAARSRDKVIADGPTQEIGGKTVEIKPRVSKGPKGKQGGKAGKDGNKGGKWGGKSGKDGQKGGKEARKGKKGEKGKSSEPRHLVLDDEEDSSSGEGDGAEGASAQAAREGSEQDLQQQMAAMGLPVAFKASENKGGEEDDDDEDEDDDE